MYSWLHVLLATALALAAWYWLYRAKVPPQREDTDDAAGMPLPA
jgi:hypothetical protein